MVVVLLVPLKKKKKTGYPSALKEKIRPSRYPQNQTCAETHIISSMDKMNVSAMELTTRSLMDAVSIKNTTPAQDSKTPVATTVFFGVERDDLTEFPESSRSSL